MSPPQVTELAGNEWTRLSVFMGLTNVHVNRIPVNGKVIHSSHHSGKFFDARLEKASEFNEHQILVIEGEKNKFKLPVVQIAGLLARRIRCDAVLNSTVEVGEVFGLIRFGSRVDLYLPKKVAPQVAIGQKVIAGETILGNYLKQQTPLSTKKL